MLELKSISKSFGDNKVLNSIDLKIEEGEFVTLLGSSGCGKTTTLRIMAGLESPDSGEVLLNGQNITELAPNKRDVNTVFQNYALFPHMNIEDNVGYSLKIKRVDSKEIKTRVAQMLDLVQLKGFEKRKPHEMSGGQRQRVAIARSLIGKPKILLLDEPLGALDLQLRQQMQTELKKLQQALGISFVYITHDQEEAINMSDKIAVMREGVFEQIGSPSEIYDTPKTAYVANFVGSANIIKGDAKLIGANILVRTLGGNFEILNRYPEIKDDDSVTVAVRSEQIVLTKDDHEGFRGIVKEKKFLGGMLRITLDVLGKELIASRHGIDSDLNVGDNVRIHFEPEHAVLVEDNLNEG